MLLNNVLFDKLKKDSNCSCISCNSLASGAKFPVLWVSLSLAKCGQLGVMFLKKAEDRKSVV